MQDFFLTFPTLMFIKGFPLYLERREQKVNHAHCHEFYELVYVLSGHGTHVYEKRPVPLLKGDLFLVLSGRPHEFTAVNKLKIVNILFTPRFFDLLEQAGSPLKRDEFIGFLKPYIYIPPICQFEVENILERIEMELKQQNYNFSVMCSSLFIEYLVLLQRLCMSKDTATEVNCENPGKTNTTDSSIASKAAQFMNERYASHITMDEVALYCNTSVSSLSRAFTAHFGIPPAGYLLKRRIQMACNLLDTRQLNVTEAALKTGFYDASHFSRAFKQALGVTPSYYLSL